METNEKYYVPTIDSFHVGFEYERMNGDRWEDAIFEASDMYGTLARGYENEAEEICLGIRDVRVKYLNKSDIESLGWKEKTYNNVRCFVYHIYRLYWFETSPTMVSIGTYREGDDEIQVFRGIIKNKSELKRIMNMINI